MVCGLFFWHESESDSRFYYKHCLSGIKKVGLLIILTMLQLSFVTR